MTKTNRILALAALMLTVAMLAILVFGIMPLLQHLYSNLAPGHSIG